VVLPASSRVATPIDYRSSHNPARKNNASETSCVNVDAINVSLTMKLVAHQCGRVYLARGFCCAMQQRVSHVCKPFTKFTDSDVLKSNF